MNCPNRPFLLPDHMFSSSVQYVYSCETVLKYHLMEKDMHGNYCPNEKITVEVLSEEYLPLGLNLNMV